MQEQPECELCKKKFSQARFKYHQIKHSSQILPWLFLGSKINALDQQEVLQVRKCQRILNCSATQVQNKFQDWIQYLSLKILDSTEQIISDEVLEQSLSFLKEAEGKSTLAHCVEGVSRSATIVIAFLMRQQDLSLKQAYAYVKERRPLIQPNPTFMQKLLEKEKEWRGGNSLSLQDLFCEKCQLPPHAYKRKCECSG